MNIILIGMRGSGKSTIAKKLSKKLGIPYIEVDKLIAEEAQMPIPHIVNNHGWEYFRDIETRITKHVCQNGDTIIATGGGVVTRSENVKALQNAGKIIYLRAQISTLLQRVGKDPNRPALTDKKDVKEEMVHILSERAKLYESAAEVIIDTDKKTTGQIVKEIMEKL